MSFRGEYVKTEIGDASAGLTAGEGGEWKAWYTQLAYRLPNTKWEGVIRYSDFDSPHNSQDVTQTMIGVNYLVTNNFIAKLAYESNDGTTDAPSDNDRALFQLSYGF
jgi:opacity protein-like surface antigen